MSQLDSILDIEEFSKWIGLQTQSSKKYLKQQLTKWNSNPQKLQELSTKFNKFKHEISKDPLFYEKCKGHFKEISEIEKKLQHLIKNESELENESYNEILFFRPILQPLNFVPYLLSLWAIIRIYILPGISLLLPILTLIAPYFIIKFAFCIPITFHHYMSILYSMVSGNIQSIFQSDSSIESSIPPAAFLKQLGIILITFIQGILQPYWTYKHLHSIDEIIRTNGDLVLKFKHHYHSLETLLTSHGFTFFKCPLPEFQGKRNATARIILDSTYFKLALKYVGSLEIIMNLAYQKDVYPVHWVSSSTPVFTIQHTYDFQVHESKRKTISATFHKQQHALLTGPNKGGKSTVLRALSVSALLAHTYGCSLGKLTSTPFHHIFVCLKPDDLPGSKSRFEREIEFTANTLTYNSPLLVFIDELYHSTNPPDALRSCEIYCKQLWNKSNIISIISTHLFDFVEKSPLTIQKLCCEAKCDKEGNVEFMYNLTNGICKVSSVDTLLKENGLIKISASE